MAETNSPTLLVKEHPEGQLRERMGLRVLVHPGSTPVVGWKYSCLPWEKLNSWHGNGNCGQGEDGGDGEELHFD